MGWFLVSILLPLLAPVVAMWVFQRLPLPVPAERKSLLMPIKDGQLSWVAVAFCALAMYEIAVPGSDGPLVAGGLLGYVNGLSVLVMVPSAFLAAGGALFPTEIVIPVKGRWYKYYQALAALLGLTTLAAGGDVVVHYGLLSP
jgi:hypothetical protein